MNVQTGFKSAPAGSRFICTWLTLLLLLILTACAGTVTTEVTRFHQDGHPAGETIAVVALDPAKTGSLEFASYARIVSEKLAGIGYRVVEPGAGPDMLAKMDYSVGPAETKIRSWPRNFVHYHFHYGDYYPFFYGRYWDEPEVYSYTVYPRALDLTITRSGGESLFEGHVKSIGREQNINVVMSYLVEAMFNNFPGESGVTKVVTIQQSGSNHPY